MTTDLIVAATSKAAASGGPAAFYLLFIAVGIFWLWMIIDAASRPGWAYAQARLDKVLWVVLVVFLSLVGSIIYLCAMRPKLIRAHAAGPTLAGMTAPPITTVAAVTSTAQPLAPRFCRHCGTTRDESARFCSGCGVAFS